MIIDCHNHIGVDLQMYLRGHFPYAQHLSDLEREGKSLGIARWIVFPMPSYLALDWAHLREGEIALSNALESVPFAWDNRRMLQEIYDLFPVQGKATIPFVMFDPAREQKAQIKALRELRGEYSFHGLKTQTTMIQSPIKSLLGEGRVFLELADEWNLPILIHSSVLPSDVWAQATDILDIAEQTPRVRFCLAHSCRFDREQLDRVAALPNAWFDCSAHGVHCQLAAQDHPIVAPKERRFQSDYARPDQVLLDLAEAYPNKLLWGSDAPFYSFAASEGGELFHLISSYSQESGYLQALPDDLKRRVSNANTLKLLGREHESI